MKVTALANGKRYVNGEGSPKNKSSSSSSSSSNAAAAVQVSFNLSCFRDVKDNEAVLLVGQTKQLGCWNVQQGVQLKSEDAAETGSRKWTAEMSLQGGEFLEFKCVVAGPDGDKWEEGENRTLLVPAGLGGRPLAVNLIWEGEERESALGERDSGDDGADEGDFEATLDKLKDRLDKIRETINENEEETQSGGQAALETTREEEKHADKQYVVAEGSSRQQEEGSDLTQFDLDSSLDSLGGGEPANVSSSWQGKEIVFMQNNDHSHERQGMVWDTSRLQEGSPEMQLVRGDQSSPSWREKLEVVEGLLCKGSESKDLSPEVVSACSIYLNWISCGAIACCEGGGHHRPCRHAESSMRMFRSLEWGFEHSARGDGGGDGSFASVLIRRLFPLLPSFSSQFRASTPLTRIRDIAHRNDIPQDLKREIKHTIQNKLHRNAGPEDLIATEHMLERITTDGNEYSEAFVEEFKRFTVELREFFSASSLDEQLSEIGASMGGEEVEKIHSFFHAKQAAPSSQPEAENRSSLADLLALMDRTTDLRQMFCRALSSGLRNDAPEAALEMRQKYRLCEIALENFAFTVASRALNAFEDSGDSSTLQDFDKLLVVLQKCMLNLSLNGFLQAECSAISNEILACSELLQSKASDEEAIRLCMLRLKACLDRTKRVCESYRDSYLHTYSSQSTLLGESFGPCIPDHTVKMFAESETRASMVFQCAKLCQLLSKNVSRDYLKSENHEWETLVAGEAYGKLLLFDSIEDHTLMQSKGSESIDKILLVRHATGDEEVSASGDGVRGVVLMHELPHLSHLAIRARQEGVVFATCTSEEEIEQLVGNFVGKNVCMNANQQKVTLAEASPPAGSGRESDALESAKEEAVTEKEEGVVQPQELHVKKSSFLCSLGMLGSTKDVCGSKAAQCGELQRLSHAVADVKFSVPSGVCLPFGTMDLMLGMQENGDAQREWEEGLSTLDSLLNSDSSGQELDQTCESLRRLIESQNVPLDFVEQSVCSHFVPSDLLIARSSANVEDLKGMSGAGLYDSILHLDASSASNVADGIKKVWASLYTRRAVLSRHKAGIQSQSTASMGVLVQKMIPSEYSFVLHTADPIMEDRDAAQKYIYAEVAPGLGETLASGKVGTPYRLRISKEELEVEIISFCNFSSEIDGADDADGPLDYSDLKYTKDPQALVDLGIKLCVLGTKLEEHFEEAQDIEGALCGDELYVVQSRPQF